MIFGSCALFLIALTDRNGNTWRYTYDADGRMTSKTDPLGNVTSYKYDSNGNLIQETTALGRETSYTYDAMDRVLSITDPEGGVTAYTYNGLDLVTHINYNGGKQVDYTYNAVGDLVRMEDWTGVNTFEHDLLGQLQRITDHKDNVVEYSYDGNGNKTSMVYPDSSTVDYTYDGVGNLTSVKVITRFINGTERIVDAWIVK